MENIQIRVFFNQRVLAMATGWQPGDILQQVWAGVVRQHNGQFDARVICDRMFGVLNDSSTTSIVPRSMSVGDVVELTYDNGQVHAWACADHDWLYISDSRDFVSPKQGLDMPSAIPTRASFTVEQWLKAELLATHTKNKILVIRFLRQIGFDEGVRYGLKETKELVDDMFAELKRNVWPE